MNRTLRWAVLLYGLLIFYITTVPFDFKISTKNIAEEWQQAEKIPFLRANHQHASGSDLLSNFLLFVPLGFLLFGLRRRHTFRSVIAVTATGFAYSLFIESFQLLLDDRYTSVNDLMMNTLGTAAGAFLGYRFFTLLSIYLQEGVRILKKRPAYLAWLIALAVQLFVVLAPFHFYIKTYHLSAQIQLLLDSINQLGSPQYMVTRFNLETLVLGMLISFLFCYAYFRSPRLTAGGEKAIILAHLFLYPMIAVLSTIKLRHPFTFPSVLFGIAGISLGFLLHALLQQLVRKERVRPFHRLIWSLFAMLFVVHFFYPFQLHSYQAWLNLLQAKQWVELPSLDFILSNQFMLDKAYILFLMAPIGYAFSRRALALGPVDRIIRILAISFVVGLIVEFIQLAIPDQEVNLLSLVFYMAGGLCGTFFERWWRIHLQGRGFDVSLRRHAPLRGNRPSVHPHRMQVS